MFKQKIIKLIIVFVFFTFPTKSNENTLLKNALKHLQSLDEFSSSFLQIQNNEISEGSIYIKGNRLRIEYITPSNIIFVLKKNQGMYFNKDLQEVQYFNPKKTIGKLLINLFNDDDFLLNASIRKKENYFYIQKEVKFDEAVYNAKIYFEEKPFQLRKLEIFHELEIMTFTLINPNYNPILNDNIFSLANPLLS